MWRKRLISLMVAIVAGDTAAADDWPQFRGPTGQGHSRDVGLPVEWSATKNVAWKQPIHGGGWSSPVVVGGRVYLTTAVTMPAESAPAESSGKRTGSGASAGSADGAKRLSLRALCLDAASGKTVWDVEVFSRGAAAAPKIHSKNGHASPTPLVEGQRLYVHFGHQGTACLDLSGKIVWRNDSVKYPPVHGGGGSPILVDDRLIYSCDGAEAPFVVALDRTTGKVAWKTKRDNDPARMLDPPKKFAFSTPLAISVGGKTQVVVPGAGAVMAYDSASGGEIWRVRYDGYSVVPRPVFGHGMVYISTGFDAPVVVAIRPDGHGDVTDTHVAWKQAKGAPNTPSLLLVGDELYMVADRGVATCADARTGQIHWQQRVPEAYSASPFAAEGKLYLLSEKGTGVVLRCGKKFEQLAANALDERSLASCAVADGALYVRTEKHLFKIRRPPLDDKTSKR